MEAARLEGEGKEEMEGVRGSEGGKEVSYTEGVKGAWSQADRSVANPLFTVTMDGGLRKASE